MATSILKRQIWFDYERAQNMASRQRGASGFQPTSAAPGHFVAKIAQIRAPAKESQDPQVRKKIHPSFGPRPSISVFVVFRLRLLRKQLESASAFHTMPRCHFL
jgi:hypothetical protein